MKQTYSRVPPPALPGIACCPHCGAMAAAAEEPVLKRGAVVVAFDPVAVWWNGLPVPLSPTEAEVFARLAQRGRMHMSEVRQLIEEIGGKAANSSLVLGYIRSKFLTLGASDPIERLSKYMVRLRVDPDGRGSTARLIGLRQHRYARAAV